MTALVSALKFGGREHLGEDLAGELSERFGPGLAAAGDVVTPVPLSWRRLLARGYNQAEALSRPLAARLALPHSRLLRRRHRRAQRRLSRHDRLGNLAGAFVARRGVAGRRVLLVDDVVTTGATLRAACAALLLGGAASVAALVAARTPRRS